MNTPVIIIPIRAELKNGNIPRLIDDIAGQTIPVRTVFVVNNSRPERDYETEIWKENLETVSFLKHHQDAADNPIVDLTDGCDRNMGLIRNAGLAAAREIAPQASAVFIHLDADCRIAPGFTESVHSALAGQQFALQPMLYLPFDNDPYIRQSFYDHHLPLLAGECVRLLSGLPATRTGAPQLAATSAAWKTIGDFPSLVEGEDFEAGQLLAKECGLLYNSDPESVVLTADRITDRGFESAARGDGKRDRNTMEQSKRRFDHPLFHLAAGIASGRIAPPPEMIVGLENEFRKSFPHVSNENGEGYSSATDYGFRPLLFDMTEFSSLLIRTGTILYPGIPEYAEQLQTVLTGRIELNFGSREDRQTYYLLASWMVALMEMGSF